jgi:ketosteroid isomerase-like protein
MRNKLLISVLLLSTLLFSAITGNAQEGRKVIAVINKADWCPVCQTNGEKMMKEIMPVFNESNVQFVMNDLTNDATKADSKMALDKVKAYDAVKKISATGWLLLIDAETGKLLEKISVAEPVEKLVMTIKKSSMVEKM